MNVAMALNKVFDNFSISVNGIDIKVNFFFGDQKEYNFWVSQKMKNNLQKYPLIWYVLNENIKNKNGTTDVNSQLILFMGTQKNYNNIERYHHNYKTYLNILQNDINKLFERHQYITLYENPINNYDEPDFGNGNNAEFQKENQRTNPKSVGIDIVDARILKIKMNINTECILNN